VDDSIPTWNRTRPKIFGESCAAITPSGWIDLSGLVSSILKEPTTGFAPASSGSRRFELARKTVQDRNVSVLPDDSCSLGFSRLVVKRHEGFTIIKVYYDNHCSIRSIGLVSDFKIGHRIV
jgi:hypothetical protein